MIKILFACASAIDPCKTLIAFAVDGELKLGQTQHFNPVSVSLIIVDAQKRVVVIQPTSNGRFTIIPQETEKSGEFSNIIE